MTTFLDIPLERRVARSYGRNGGVMLASLGVNTLDNGDVGLQAFGPRGAMFASITLTSDDAHALVKLITGGAK